MRFRGGAGAEGWQPDGGNILGSGAYLTPNKQTNSLQTPNRQTKQTSYKVCLHSLVAPGGAGGYMTVSGNPDTRSYRESATRELAAKSYLLQCFLQCFFAMLFAMRFAMLFAMFFAMLFAMLLRHAFCHAFSHAFCQAFCYALCHVFLQCFLPSTVPRWFRGHFARFCSQEALATLSPRRFRGPVPRPVPRPVPWSVPRCGSAVAAEPSSAVGAAVGSVVRFRGRFRESVPWVPW